jgi:hypothetical protein
MRFGERGISIRAEQHGIGSVDAGKAQLLERLTDRGGIIGDVRGEIRRRIGAALADAGDAGGREAVEDRAVFRERQFVRGGLRGLPVAIVGAAFDAVDRFALQRERHGELHELLHVV